MAFQQIQIIANDSANKLGEELKKLAETEGEIAEKLGGIRAACLRAKRSKDGCSKAIEQLVQALDRIDKIEKEKSQEEQEDDLENEQEYDKE